MLIRISLAVVVISLSACATPSIPKFEDYGGKDMSCVEGNEWPSIIKLYSEGEAHVWLKEVDGLPTRNQELVCLTPGNHVLGIQAHNQREYSTIRLKFDFKPQEKYQIRANKLGITFHYKLLNVSAERIDVVAKIEAEITSRAPSSSVPIFIPAGR